MAAPTFRTCAPRPSRTMPGETFRFTSQNYVNEKLDTSIDGRAERARKAAWRCLLEKPKATKFELENGVIFPTGQTKAIVEAGAAWAIGLRIADLRWLRWRPEGLLDACSDRAQGVPRQAARGGRPSTARSWMASTVGR